MTEKEKGAVGYLYDANHDPALVAERMEAKSMCFAYNNTHPAKRHEREELLRRLLWKTGGDFLIEPPFYCDYGYNIEIGENFYVNHHCVILDTAKVSFGDNVMIGPNCGFYAAGHPLDVDQRNAGLEFAYPITVGNNVWIGGHAAVMPGVSIGDNTVIGAGSVVTKDIPAGVIAIGNPCRVLREITDDDRNKYKEMIR